MSDASHEVVFVGSSEPEAAANRLKAAGVTFKRKRLDSRPENWFEIARLIDQDSVRCAVVKLMPANVESLLEQSYRDCAETLFDAIASKPHLIFAHESILTGETVDPKPKVVDVVEGPDGPVEIIEDEMYDWHEAEGYWNYIRQTYLTPPSRPACDRLGELLDARGLELTPYRTNAELDVIAGSFVEDSRRDLLFRIYIPGGRLYAAEADALLRMFREWLGQAGRHSVRQDGYTTQAGQVIEFFGDGSLAQAELTTHVDRFSDFLVSCVSDPQSAVDSLESSGLPALARERLVAKFAREARRLQIDVRHAREARLMELRHSFESEMLEYEDSPVATALLDLEASGLGVPLLGALVPSAGAGTTNVTISIGQQVLGDVTDSIVQSIQGTAALSPEALEILSLVEQYGADQQVELTSAVHELEDPDARSEDRIVARQKLKGFLLRLGRSIESSSFELLKKYVEMKLGF